MKWFGNTSRVWQTALPGATTRTAAVFLAGQAHHAASPLRLFESGEWFLFAGSQTPLTALSSSLSSVWMSAHWPQDGSYKPFDLFPRPSVCEHVCGCVSGEKKTLSGFWWGGGLMEGDGVSRGAFGGHLFVWLGGAPCGTSIFPPLPLHLLLYPPSTAVPMPVRLSQMNHRAHHNTPYPHSTSSPNLTSDWHLGSGNRGTHWAPSQCGQSGG